MPSFSSDSPSPSHMGQPSSSSAAVPPRRISVHQALGGGSVADVLLWRRWSSSAAALIAATMTWFALEGHGYNAMTFAANVLLLLVLILFLWAKSASLLNRPMPLLPNLVISEEYVERAADVTLERVNTFLCIAREIAIERDFRLFVQVASTLWFISYVGSIFNFLTLIYIGVVLALFVPFLYDKYQDIIDEKLYTVFVMPAVEAERVEGLFVASYVLSPTVGKFLHSVS